MISILGDKNVETPTGYHRWLISIVISLAGVFGSCLYVTYAAGQSTKQIETNTLKIESLDGRVNGLASKEDVDRLEKQINRLEDKIDRIVERDRR